MKIQRIYVENFKAVDKQELVLNGCSAIVTAGNDQGKTSILSGLIDRLRSDYPEKIVREGEEKGENIVELTDKSKIEWHFTEKSERLVYITPDGMKVTSGVISTIGERYFGQKFDIDAFLNSPPKKQRQWMEKVAKIDLSKVDREYQQAYDDRTEKNREVKRLSAMDLDEPEQVERPDIEAIKAEMKEAREHNQQLKEDHEVAAQAKNIVEAINEDVEDTPLAQFFDYDGAWKYVKEITPDADYKDTDAIEQRLEEANEQLRKYDSYERDLDQYEQWKDNLSAAKDAAEEADEQVKAIEQKRQKLIADADLPEGFDIAESGLTYNGFPLSDAQISKSSKYIAALKLGERVIGEVRTLHFDASNLDRDSLQEVQTWADEKDLQLLIERPDFEGGEIKYELIAD